MYFQAISTSTVKPFTTKGKKKDDLCEQGDFWCKYLKKSFYRASTDLSIIWDMCWGFLQYIFIKASQSTNRG